MKLIHDIVESALAILFPRCDVSKNSPVRLFDVSQLVNRNLSCALIME